MVSYNMMLSCKDVCQDERRAIMDLYQLECFRVVASMQHISNAATAHITQSALSKIINRVEDYAGMP